MDAVDKATQTITVAGKAIRVSASTKLTKAGKMIAFGDIAVGDEVRGLAKTASDGKSEASTLTVGPEKGAY